VPQDPAPATVLLQESKHVELGLALRDRRTRRNSDPCRSAIYRDA